MERLFDDGLYRVGGTREQRSAGWSYLLRRKGDNLLLLNLAGSSVAAPLVLRSETADLESFR